MTAIGLILTWCTDSCEALAGILPGQERDLIHAMLAFPDMSLTCSLSNIMTGIPWQKLVFALASW